MTSLNNLTRTAHNAIHIGREVIDIEMKGLKALSDSLGDTFARAVDILLSTKGRVITTGMGKSGHVARKIAASLASTGTPSFYLHPAEASHGDLGMITSNDTVIALSNSGETRELADIIGHTRRHGNPLISMTQGEDSALALASTLVLSLPAVAEACPNGLAPTTSTTMMLALGDALAITLLKQRCFSKDDFKALHPGGSLGVRLKRIQSIMHKSPRVPLVDHATLMSDALLVMTSHRFGCVGVVDKEGQLAGIITDGDLRRHMSSNLLKQAVSDIMTKNPQTIHPEALVEEAIHRMQGTITTLFVTDGQGRPVGLVHIHDLLRLGVV